MSDILSNFKIDRPVLFQESKLFISYIVEEKSTGHTFLFDYTTKKITTSNQKEIFEKCCKSLKENKKYYPSFLTFHDGVINEENKGILIWRCIKSIIPLKEQLNKSPESWKIQDRILFLGIISNALKMMPEMKVGGYFHLTIDNIFIENNTFTIPILARYGIHDLLLSLYGESGKIPTLILPPDKSNIDQKEISNNEHEMPIFDSYAFGVLMYQVLTNQILDKTNKFDKKLVEDNLQGSDNLFLKEMILNLTTENPDERTKHPFSSIISMFVTFLQEQMKPVLFKSYCQFCENNGDLKAKSFLNKTQRQKTKKETGKIRGTSERTFHCHKPTAVSLIIGKKVIHNIDAFQRKLKDLDPTKRVIFITMFGSYQMGKSTTLCLLSGNTKYVIGNGVDETTRGVSIDGPYNLSHFSKCFGEMRNLDEKFPLNCNENMKREDPYVFLIDIEGFSGDIIGYDSKTNENLYRNLVKPYLALTTNVLVMCNKNEGRKSRDYVVKNLNISNFGNLRDGLLMNLMLVIKDVDTIVSLEGEFEFDDPFDIEQVNDASEQFFSKFQDSFVDKGITTNFQPLAPYNTHLEPETPNSDIPLFDKSFIVMARQLLNEIYTLESTTHVTNGEGAIQMFNEINNLIIQNGFATDKNDAEQVRQIESDKNKVFIEALIQHAKKDTIQYMKEQIESEDINSIDLLEFDIKRTEWNLNLNNKFNEELQKNDLASHDQYGIKEALLLETMNEINKIINLKFNQKVANNTKERIALLVPNKLYELERQIEQSILSDDTWKYFSDNYKNKDSFINDKYNLIHTEIMNDPSVIKTTSEEFQNWLSSYLNSEKIRFTQNVNQIFDKTNIVLAKRRKPRSDQIGDPIEIPGNKKYNKVRILLTWDTPNGTQHQEESTGTAPKKHKCLLI